MAKTSKATKAYENNPFTIGLSGLKLLFARAHSVAIFAIVLCSLAIVGQLAQSLVDITSGYYTKSNDQLKQEQAQQLQSVSSAVSGMDGLQLSLLAIFIGSIIFLFILVAVAISGILDHTASQLSKNKSTTLKESTDATFRLTASYLWMNIILGVKLFLWTLLFIVPGIIMFYRYSLAGVVFFAEDRRGNDAIKRSAELTKGAWFTTFGAIGLWNLITFGVIQSLLMPGTMAILYRQLAAVTDAGEDKPPAHWLSWLTFFVPIACVVLLIGLVFAIAVLVSVSMTAR